MQQPTALLADDPARAEALAGLPAGHLDSMLGDPDRDLLCRGSDPRLDATLPAEPPPAGLVITATLDGHPLLRLDGRNARMEHLLLTERCRLVAALAQALQIVTTAQPEPSPLLAALDAVETLAALRTPPGAADALAPIREAIAECHATLSATDAASLNP